MKYTLMAMLLDGEIRLTDPDWIQNFCGNALGAIGSITALITGIVMAYQWRRGAKHEIFEAFFIGGFITVFCIGGYLLLSDVGNTLVQWANHK